LSKAAILPDFSQNRELANTIELAAFFKQAIRRVLISDAFNIKIILNCAWGVMSVVKNTFLVFHTFREKSIKRY